MVYMMRENNPQTYITKHDRLVISAYTGYLMADPAEVHHFIEETLGYPIFTHELTKHEIVEEIQKKLHTEWLKISKANGE